MTQEIRHYRKCDLRLVKTSDGKYVVMRNGVEVSERFERMIPARKEAEARCKAINPNYGVRGKK